MQQIRKTSAIFFLSMYCMLMLHQVLPHLHHEHEGSEMVVGHIDHHDLDNEKGPHHHDEEDESFDLLAFFLGIHSHSVNASNIPVVKNAFNFIVVNKSVSVHALFDVKVIFSENDKHHKTEFGKAPPDFLNNVYLSTHCLRGPPVVG